jgi:16S rRNA (cytidine1402-2'-O)-methyltransferase
MSLTVVSTPIGNPKDITLHALEELKNCDLIIGEEPKEARRILKSLNLPLKDIIPLNEHSNAEDVLELVKECNSKHVALMSDCGTPSFCDPGFQLVKACRAQNIPVKSCPGASSLMVLLSLSSEKLTEFVFLGFPPKNNENRKAFYNEIKNENRPLIFMDTPYRLTKTLEELAALWPKRKALLGINLTQENELQIEATLLEIKQQCPNEKEEFIILLYANENQTLKSPNKNPIKNLNKIKSYR